MVIERAATAKVPPVKAWPVAAAIALNLIPIVGVLFWGWSVFALVFLYWLENVVIGVRTALSMAMSGLSRGSVAQAIGISLFFTVHYGIFTFVHGMFVVTMFGDVGPNAPDDVVSAGRALFASQPNLVWGLASIVLWQIVQLLLFVVRGEARTTEPLSLMAAPYPRIIILHITILFGGFVLLMLDQPLAGLVVLTLVKTAFDVAEARGAPLFVMFNSRTRQP